jgi:hypothetical protein
MLLLLVGESLRISISVVYLNCPSVRIQISQTVAAWQGFFNQLQFETSVGEPHRGHGQKFPKQRYGRSHEMEQTLNAIHFPPNRHFSPPRVMRMSMLSLF